MDDNLIKKIPPHNVEAEQSVVGAILLDPETVLAVAPILRGEDFYQPSYGILYDAMVELYLSGNPVDQVTLSEKLKEKNAPSEICDADFLAGLVMAVPTSANAESYARIVAEKATLRRLIKITDDISGSCYLDREPLESILDQTERGVFDLVKKEGREDFKPIDKIVIDVLGKIEAASKNHGVVTGLATGFADLDRQTTGLQPSDLILIAARPSMGKTAFALNIGQYASMKLHKKVALFSLEMSREQLVNRLLASQSRIDAQNLRNGNLREEAKAAMDVLDEYARTFQERNPNLHVFNSVLHMDEATPHLHLDYIPVAHGYKTGLKTRNSLTKALQEMGIAPAVSNKDTETMHWQERERAFITELQISSV